MSGLDADRAAVAVKVDPRPLAPAGELAALLSGRATFAFRWLAGVGRYEIDMRDPWAIAGNPPGTQRNVDVVAEHRCHGMPLKYMGSMHVHSSRQAMPVDPPF